MISAMGACIRDFIASAVVFILMFAISHIGIVIGAFFLIELIATTGMNELSISDKDSVFD
ncbi:MAG: hypothetical protein ACTSYF_00365 [Promethearchaeota archaeon]